MSDQILQAGEIIGDGYVIERLLGGGGMGQVYLARDPRLDRLVAIKLLHEDVALSEEADSRFRREARALSRVVHPNVVGIHAFGRRDATWYLVMEYVEGYSLEQVLEDGPMPLAEVVHITRQVASGLAEAHALGIIHRDVKPGNILLRPLASGGLLAKVVDFGLARQFEGQQTHVVTQQARILGTPAYMSPEQIQAQPLDGRTDLYALAAMVYQMLTGRLPYHRETLQGLLMAHLVDQPAPIDQRGDATIPQAVQREILRGLEKSPDQRHASVVAFAQALEDAADLTGRVQAGEGLACPGCGVAPVRGGGFCTRCGSAIPLQQCGACGARRQGERYHCSDCGASLLAWPAGASALTAGLRLFSAIVVVCRLRAQGADLQVQADFAGSFAAAIGREGGRAVAVLGQEAVALFGLGGMREGDLATAADAALALPALFATTESGQRPDVSMQIGLELGLVSSRGIGVAWGLAVVGGQAVEAARACALTAPLGGVSAGESAYRDLRGQFESRLEPGSKRPVLVRRRDATAALADYMGRDRHAAWLGRSAELAMLQRLARKSRRDGCLSAVPILGPTSAGKSRLVGELLKKLDESGEPWRLEVARCPPQSGAGAWQPLLDLLRHRLDSVAEGGDLAARMMRLPGLDDGDSEQLHRRVQALLRMVGLDRPPTQEPLQQAVPKPASEAELHAAFEAWGALLQGLCQEKPLVIVVEDLQHARPTTLALIGHIARKCEDSPLLLLLPLRNEHAEAVLAGMQLPALRNSPIELEPLELAEVEALVRSILPGFAPPAALVHAIARFAEGLPGRVEQALDALMDEGVLLPTAQGWHVDRTDVAVGVLERSASELLLRRVGRLAPAERSVLESLAVAGNSAPQGQLVAMRQETLNESDLAKLARAGLLQEARVQPFAGQRQWRLLHPQLGPLLREAMARAPRVALHRAAARWLEAWSGARPPGYGAALASHHLQAGDAPDAARHLLQNARDAVRAFATRDGFDAYCSAADVAAGWLNAHPGDDALRGVLLAALGGIAETGLRIGELDRALLATEHASLAAGDQGPWQLIRLRLQCVRGQILDSKGHPDEAIAALRQAIDTARTRTDGFAVSIFAVSLICMVLQRCGRIAESVAIAEQALLQCDQAEGIDDPELFAGVGRLHTWLGHAASRQKEFAKAQAEYAAASRVFHRIGDDIGAAMAELSTGNVAYRAGQLATAEDVYRDVSSTCEALDDVIGQATAQTNLGNVLLDQGRAQEALAALMASDRLQRRSGRLENLPETLRLQALACVALADPLRGRALAQEALTTAERFGQVAAIAGIRQVLQAIGA